MEAYLYYKLTNEELKKDKLKKKNLMLKTPFLTCLFLVFFFRQNYSGAKFNQFGTEEKKSSNQNFLLTPVKN